MAPSWGDGFATVETKGSVETLGHYLFALHLYFIFLRLNFFTINFLSWRDIESE